MKSVGVRALRQNASGVLRQVEQGTTFQVTDRGRPVALLGPLSTANPLERLRAAGETDSPEADFADLPPPLTLPKGEALPSAVLRRLRADER